MTFKIGDRVQFTHGGSLSKYGEGEGVIVYISRGKTTYQILTPTATFVWVAIRSIYPYDSIILLKE